MKELFTPEQIAARTDALAGEIIERLGTDFILAPVLTGGFVFAADLVRALVRHGADPQVDFVQLASYGDARSSSGLVRVIKDFTGPVEGRTVLLVDDVLDSGRSLAHASRILEDKGVKRAWIAVAVDKQATRAAHVTADFAAFTAPGDAFLVGYGMDDAGGKRGLPYIGVV
ncbi:phosphoribosyltransferase [Parvularcula dongshanensis]|uniref:Hypoxanthine phosphoribosyltransferase n=1 Tax=Parvularcula dongshanensis TaxID=1173995 RepID=A0A840I2U2_9PROT|nr:phosphoribosyltransferase family protein [Parvularcula dongshanensis]MBB4658593.1 hypoxanthine phosphoribosyltransferase [Parvularcula dongshanensis]